MTALRRGKCPWDALFLLAEACYALGDLKDARAYSDEAEALAQRLRLEPEN